MTILFAGGEDHEFGGTFSVVTTAGRFRSGYARCALELESTSGTKLLSPQITPQTTLWAQCWAYFSQIYAANAAINNDDGTLFSWYLGGTPYLRLTHSSSNNTSVGGMRLWKWGGSSWASLGYTTDTLPAHLLMKITTKVVVDPSAGVFELYVNDGLWFSLTGIDTQGANPGTTVDQVALWNAYTSITGQPTDYSEMIVADADPRPYSLRTLVPNGAGNHGGWSGAYTDVDETTLSDADVIASATPGDQVSFAFSDLAAAGAYQNLAGVLISARAIQDGAGPTTLKGLARSGTTDSATAGQTVSATDLKQFLIANDPATAAPWTREAVNAAEFGLESAA
jgi:hypothetical protein